MSRSNIARQTATGLVFFAVVYGLITASVVLTVLGLTGHLAPSHPAPVPSVFTPAPLPSGHGRP
jgi:hypothetical protein